MNAYEHKTILADVSYLRRLAEELIDELYFVEFAVEEMYQNRRRPPIKPPSSRSGQLKSTDSAQQRGDG